ncbi:MMPL family transporter [Nocardia sp. CDC160]|uniref:MMPL family transporter n=1 Tax=Nocardia sp. CDC160 TaxID=3112166 RepID=UPI002DBE128D|nr:MMPL family transporter [Nocardia sp. CDC160]MEC3914953.1 MMPL family transporter [Nocardia sp. CDC160]
MSALLGRIGDFAFRRRGLVVSIWVLVLIAVVGGAALAGGRLDDRFTVPGAESQHALDTLSETAPGAAGATAQLVFTAPAGHLITEAPYRTAIQHTLDVAGTAPGAVAVTTPQQAGTISADQRTAVGVVSFAGDRSRVSQDARATVERSADSARDAGLDVSVGGTAYGVGDMHPGITEIIGLGVAVLVLLITFGSLLAAGMPLLSAISGIAVTVGGLLALAAATPVSSTALTLALMLGLAVGIDYALFILSRHRSQLAAGLSPRESVVRANQTAGSAVVFAGTTVVIALAALSVIGIPFLTVMGLAASGAVLVAVAVALTLLPALTGFAGHRLTPRPGSRTYRRIAATGAEAIALDSATSGPDGDVSHPNSPARHTESPVPRRDSMGARWARMVTARPIVTIAAVAGALILLAIPTASLRMALPDNGSAAVESGQRQAYDTIAEKFGPGFNGPLVLVVDAENDPKAAALVAQTVRELPNVAYVAPPQPTQRAGQSLVMVVPKTAPESGRTADLVHAIRGQVPDAVPNASIAVTGDTAVAIDVSQRLSASLLPFLGIVVGLSLLLLVVVFRSIAVPVKATLTFLLSVAAALGTTVAVFQWGWAADLFGVSRVGPVVSVLPIILVGVLFGLAMDYEVFLVSGMREEWLRAGDARRSIVEGTRHNARVVTAAATIMVVVFASFVPTDDALVKPIAFALAVGVLVDAFAVRLTLVPAVLALLGRAAWWLPRRLDRVLPTLNLEGEEVTPPRAPLRTPPRTPSRDAVPAASTQ